MTEKTAYVVMLPLTDEQVLSLLDSYTGSAKSTNALMNETIRAIGTPVDSSVPVVGYEITLNGSRVALSRAKFADVSEDIKYESRPLVRQSDHLAALAEKQAEVERLRAALQPFSDAAYTYDAEGNEYERDYPDEFAIDKDPEDEETGSGLKVAHLREARRVFEAQDGAAS